MFTLTSLQQEAVNKFRERDYGALFMDMGTGKTLALLQLARARDPDLVLYVAPNSTLAQIRMAADELGMKVSAVSYEALAGSDSIYISTLRAVRAARRVVIIADESTAMKNNSKTTSRMMDLRKHAVAALIATATPITNDELDLFNQLTFLSPNVLKMTRADFLANFYKRIVYQKAGMKKPKEFFVFSNINRRYLQRILDQVSIQGSLELSFTVNDSREFVTPTEQTLARFGRRRVRILEKIRTGSLDDGEALTFLVWVNRLFAMDQAKNQRVAQQIAGDKVVCFSMFRDEQAGIAAELDEIGAQHLVINGDTPMGEREQLLERFAIEEVPLLITYGVGGHGLNLQSAHKAVFSSVGFDWEKIEQARGRIARLGQTSPTIDYSYILSDSQIVKMIFENLSRKTAITKLVKEVIRHV